MKRAIIFSRGGVVQATAADPGVKIALVDWDESEDPSYGVEFRDPDGDIESITDPDVFQVVPELKEPERDSPVPATEMVRTDFENGDVTLVLKEFGASFTGMKPRRSFLHVNPIEGEDDGRIAKIGFLLNSMGGERAYFEIDPSTARELLAGLTELIDRTEKGQYDDPGR